MKFIYVVINFVLLVTLLVLVGRKIVLKIFRTRLEKINKELDEAEKPFVLDPLPEFHVEKSNMLELGLQELQEEENADLSHMKEQQTVQLADMRHEMLYQTRAKLIDDVMQKAAERMDTPEYRSILHAGLDKAVQKILDSITLTPGDMAYISQADQLYVTLASAEPLSDTFVAQIESVCTKLISGVNSKVSFRVLVKPELLGGIRLRIGDTIYDYTTKNKLYRLKQHLNDRLLTAEKGEDLLDDIYSAMDATPPDIDIFQVGRVLSVGDGICWLDGVADIMFGELVEFESGQQGMVMDIQSDRVGCIIFGRFEHIEAYSRVRRLNIMTSVPVGDAMLGRVVDALGNPVDGKGRIWTTERRNIEQNAPSIPDRQSVNVPLHTGIKAIDALVPIGRGQRELIIGDRQTGKSAIAVDTILAQKDQNMKCIYVAIGQKNSYVSEIVSRLEEGGAMDYTIVVSATASDSSSLQYIAPFAGTAMAEYFMYKGQDVLIIYDDLSKHAVAYRELSLLLHRPSGREAYPGDIFYLHSRLLERCARINEKAGGGSITGLPIVETQAGDISAYIPTNVISITDGQIFLETDLFNAGQRPAINAGLSVSRVGGSAQSKLMKQLSSSLRTTLAQYRELAAFTQLGSELDETTQKSISAGDHMMAALRQERYSCLKLWEECLLLYAVSHGYADQIPTEEMSLFEKDLYQWFSSNQPELVKILQTGAKLTPEVEAKLSEALSTFIAEDQ